MKNKLKLFTLSAVSFIAMSLVSCDVTEKGNVVIEINGTQITADEMYEQYKLTSTGTKAYFNAIYNVVLRYEMDNYSSKKTELVNKAKSRVQGVKDDATNNASTNSTSYDDELDKLLDTNGVDDLDQLQTKFEDEAFKEYLEDKFYDDYIEYLKDGTPIDISNTDKEITPSSYLNEVLPYHVKHILVKVTASSGEYARSTITKDESIKLSSVITRLAKVSNNASSETFGQIAKSASDDTGSAATYGDLGIMSKNTSYVDEFKLGVYTYDSLFNSQITTTAEKDKIGLTDTASEINKYESQLEELGLGEIPYAAALALNKYADKTTDDLGEKVNDGASIYYPRNIIWNKYFNLHNVSVITNSDLDFEQFNGGLPFTGLSGFKDITFNINGTPVVKNVLCDENGNPILVTRAGTSGDNSYQGVHFIVVQRSALVAQQNGTSLSEYYTTYLPGSTNFPKNTDGSEKITYVNYLKDDKSSYLTRSDNLKDDIKTADPSISLKMYEYFFIKSGAKIKDSTVETQINKYINSTVISNKYSEDKEYEDSWKNYTNMLGVQSDSAKRKISTTCVVKFKDAYDEAFEKGGECYYEK